MMYLLLTDEGRKKKYAYAIDLNDWPKELIICPKCRREWEKTLVHEYGIDIPVVLSNDHYPDFLYHYINHISVKAKDVMQNEGIKGYTLEKAHILSVNDLAEEQIKELRYDGVKIKKIPVDPPPYYKMHVEMGGEYHDKSNIILLESCSECGYERYVTPGKEWVDTGEFFLSLDSLKGYDLFRVKGYGFNIFCTEKFREVYQKHALTGLLFKEVQVL